MKAQMSKSKLLKTILFFLVIVAISTFLLFLIIRNDEVNQTNSVIEKLRVKDQKIGMIERSFNHLLSADNSFKYYSISYNQTNYIRYKNEIGSLKLTLDTLKTRFESDSNEGVFLSGANKSIQQKFDISASFLKLKRLTDSLLYVAVSMDSIQIGNQKTSRYTIKKYDPSELKTILDTMNVFTTTTKTKKGIFGKIKSFIAGETEKVTTQQQIAISNTDSLQTTDPDSTSQIAVFTDLISNKADSYYQNQLRIQKSNRGKLEEKEKQLIKTNTELIANLNGILQSLNKTILQRNNEIKETAYLQVEQSTKKMNRTSIFSISLVIILSLLIVFVLNQIKREELLSKQLLINDLECSKEEYRVLYEALEDRVKERTLQLEIANQDLESFAHSVSHDLRAPLRHIDGFTRIIRNSLEKRTPEQERLFEKVSEASSKMAKMIDDLLTFSRLGRKSIDMTKVNLNEMARKVIDQFAPDIETRKIEWKIGELPIIQGDASLMHLVFENLISNAIKFTSKNDKALIEIGKINDQEKNGFFIRDNGVGFNMKYADKLFGVFQRLHTQTEFEGTGIGLANIKQIIQKHGGTISANSEVGKGATFYIYL